MATGYRDLHIYDAPGVALSQVVGGHASLGGLVDTVVSPESLAPEERKTMAERLLDQGSGVGSFVVNTLTNPFVLAMMFTHAPVGRALAKGRDPFIMAPGKGAAHQEYNAMANASLLGLGEETRGTHAFTVFKEAHEAVKGAQDGITERVGGPLGRLLEKLGVDTFDVAEIERRYGPEKALEVQRLHNAATIRLFQMEKAYAPVTGDIVLTYGTGRKIKGPEGESGWSHAILGEQKDPGVVEKWQETKNAYEKWWSTDEGKELKELLDFQKELKRAGKRLNKKNRARVSELFEAMPDTPFVIPKYVKGEKPSFEMRWAPEGSEGDLAAYRDMIEAEAPAEYHEWVGALKAEMERQKANTFDIVDGRISDERTGRMVRSIQVKNAQGDHKIMGPVDSPVGSYGKYGGDDAFDLVFGKYHQNAIEMGAATEADGLETARQVLMGGDAFADHYIPFNTVQRVVTPAMVSNPNLRPANTSVLQAFDGMGMKDGVSAAKGLAIGKKGGAPLMVHPEDLYGFTRDPMLPESVADHMTKMIWEADSKADELLAKHQMAMPALRINAAKVGERYVREAATYAEMLKTPSVGMRGAQAAAVRSAKETKGWSAPFEDPLLKPLGGGNGVRVHTEWGSPDVDPRLQTVEGMIRNAILFQADKNVQMHLRESASGFMSRAPKEARIMKAAMWQAKKGLASFLGTGLGKWINENVPPLGKRLRLLADPNLDPGTGGGIWGGIARMFYVSHLGVNLGSMVMNLMQPVVMTAPQLGLRNTLAGYKRAISDLWTYATKRVERYGLGMITPRQRQELLDEVLPHAREWGIGGDHLSMLDTVTFGNRLGKKRGFFDKVEEVFLKGFEKTEWLNRMVTGHGYDHAWEASGKPKGQAFRDSRARFISTTQFTNSPENTPRMFLPGGLLGNQALRMFMSFPLRTATGVFYMSPMLGGQGSYAAGLANTVVRGLGMSAIIYEAGKSLAGVDLSKGLWASSVTDLAGGDKFLESGNSWIKVPPIISVPHDFIAGLAQGDSATLTSAISRVVPGGIALSRLMGVMPETGLPIFSAMQKTTADWSNPLEDGRIPVYKGGRLVDYKSPSELVMRGLGVDMGRFNEPGSLDGYLVKQREEILNARHEYLRAMVANDFRGAEKTAKAFESKFGVPLTVSQAQVRAFVQSRQVPRTERILDRLPSDVRQLYGDIVQGSRGLNVPASSLAQGGTARSRSDQREVSGQADIERAVQAAMQAQANGSMEFGSFNT